MTDASEVRARNGPIDRGSHRPYPGAFLYPPRGALVLKKRSLAIIQSWMRHHVFDGVFRLHAATAIDPMGAVHLEDIVYLANSPIQQRVLTPLPWHPMEYITTIIREPRFLYDRVHLIRRAWGADRWP